ncbi:MAG: hypothetical protein GDA38_02470 [Hormoscilla sp. SP12CHS1]|nr:hypothetical protein [Hormoscilla sp. SP12CHS1]
MNKCVDSLSNLQFLGLSKNSLRGTLPTEVCSEDFRPHYKPQKNRS